MQFHRANHSVLDFNYKLGDQTISSKTTLKDNNLNWTNHYEHICSAAYRILGLLKRTFSSTSTVSVKKKLFISLVRSQLSYCSQIWRPALIKDIRKLETVQRRATKFIIGNSMDYRNCLIKLEIMPLMYYLEMADIMFLVNSLKNPSVRFNIRSYINFQDNTNTRSSSKLTLKHVLSSSHLQSHFYFNRLPKLWNKLPPIDLTLSSKCIKHVIFKYLWSHFIKNFTSDNPCTYHFSCPCNKCSAMPSSFAHLILIFIWYHFFFLFL